MPHKRNPVSAAVVLSAAIRVPPLVATMLAAMVQEHERGVGGCEFFVCESGGVELFGCSLQRDINRVRNRGGRGAGDLVMFPAEFVEALGRTEPSTESVDENRQLVERIRGGRQPGGGSVDSGFDAFAFQPQENAKIRIHTDAHCAGTVGQVVHLCAEVGLALHDGQHGAAKE